MRLKELGFAVELSGKAAGNRQNWFVLLIM
jgi:hypothetical protein